MPGSVKSAVTLVFLSTLGLSLRWSEAPRSVAAAQVSPTATAGPSTIRSMAVLTSFVTAYNRGDLAGVFATMAMTHSNNSGYYDCDPATLLGVRLQAPRTLAQWFKARFAEHDAYTVEALLQSRVRPRSVGFQGRRASDVFRAQGTVSLAENSKMVVDERGSGLVRVMLGSPCERERLLSRAARARGMLVALLDAYNARDLSRVMQLVAPSVTYRDCTVAGQGRVNLRGRKSVARWLRTRLAVADRFTLPAIAPSAFTVSGTGTSTRVGLAVVRPGVGRVVVSVRTDIADRAIMSVRITNSFPCP